MSPPFRRVPPSEPRCLTAGLARGKAEAKDRSGPAALGALRPRHDPRVPSPPPSIPSSPPPNHPHRRPPPSSVLRARPLLTPYFTAPAPTRERKSRLPRPLRAPIGSPLRATPPCRRVQLPRALKQTGRSVPSEVFVGAAAATFPRPQSSRA